MRANVQSEWSRKAKDALAIGVVAALFAAPYFTWIGDPHARYVAADTAILLLLAFRWRKDTIRRAGLGVPLKAWLPMLLLFVVGVLVAGALVGLIEQQRGFEVAGHRPLYSLSQVFHQELVLRGLLLGALASRFRSDLRVAVSVALVFAVLHPLLFVMQGRLVLPATTVLSLFLFGLATNWLFLRTRHIGFVFAMHAAWNLCRFGAHYRGVGDIDRGGFMSEAESFAVIEGAWPTVGAAVVLTAVVFCFPRIKRFAARFPRDSPNCRIRPTPGD